MFKFFKHKKWTASFAALMMVLTCVTPLNVFADEVVEPINNVVKEEKAVVNTEVKETNQIDIVAFNDFHGSLKESASGKNLGVAKLVSAVKAIKEENPNTIVLAAGDNYQGSAMSNLTHGAPVSEMMKELGVEASAVGNHEFDWGIQWTKKWQEDGEFDFLASNIYDKATGEPVEWAKPYKVVEKAGIKVGIIGLTTLESAYKTKAENVKDIEFKELKPMTEKWANYLKSGDAPEGKVDVVIALTHVGSLQDRDTNEISGEVVDSKICEVENLDAVITAHTHQRVSGMVNGKPVVQGYKNGRAISKLTIKLDENGKVSEIAPSLDLLYKNKSEMVANEAGQAIYDKYNEKLSPILDEVIGTTDKELSHDRYAGPSIVGEWTCEVMRKAAGTQIAVTNGGGLRCSIPEGNITMGKMYEFMPYDNTLVKMELKGSDLKKVIEHGILNSEIGWIQIAGVKATYNKDGKIVTFTLEDGTAIEMDKYYTVVTNDFQFGGGDKYDFSGAKNVVNMFVPIRDALVEEIKTVKNISFEKVGYLTEAPKATYVVRIGDTLGKIAAKYGVTYEEIAEFNKLENAALIFPGDKIDIPGKVVSEEDNTYKVEAGDTLGSIAQKFGMDYKAIAEFNKIENPNLIFVGQEIAIPTK